MNRSLLCPASLRPALLLLLLLVSAGCRDALVDDEALGLVAVVWELTFIEQANGVQTNIGTQGMVLQFFPDDSLKGFSYNIDDRTQVDRLYVSTYQADPTGRLAIAPTELAGGPNFLLPRGSKWFEYQRALSEAFQYEIEAEVLLISYPGIGGTQRLHFAGTRADAQHPMP